MPPVELALLHARLDARQAAYHRAFAHPGTVPVFTVLLRGPGDVAHIAARSGLTVEAVRDCLAGHVDVGVIHAAGDRFALDPTERDAFLAVRTRLAQRSR